MDFNAKTNEVAEKKIAYKEAVEQPIDCDITLPEYFPDVQRILKCTLCARINTVQKSGDRVTAEGTGHLSVLYVSEGNCIRCFEQSIPFSRFAESKEIEHAECAVRAKTEYVNCRAVSGRRLDIHGCLSVMFTCYTKARHPLICGCEGGGVQTKTKNFNVCNLEDCCERAFCLNETFEIGTGKPSIVQLIRSDASAVIEDTKVVSGKILIKGELNIRTLYISEDESDEIQSIDHAMPISQIIEVDGAQDGCVDVVRLDISGLEVSAKTDTAGALRLLEASVDIRAFTEIYMEKEMTAVTDAYSTCCEMTSKCKQVGIRNLCDSFTDTYLCRSSLDLSGTDIERVIDMSVAGLTCTSACVQGELSLKGTITVNLLLCAADGEISFSERQFDYEYKRSVSVGTADIECEPHAVVTGVNYLLGSDNKIDARVELELTATVFTVTTISAVAEMELLEEKPKAENTAALTIYFSEAGESVWEIARRYNTTVQSIMAENKLTDDVIAEKCKLLIPRA